MHPDLIEKVDRFLVSTACQNTSIVTAISGGIDSVVMFHALHAIQDRRRLSINLVHVNHALRGSASDADELFVRDLAALHGCPFHSATVDVHAHAENTGKGIEASARELRYGVLFDVAQQTGSSAVLVGHNADDVAETLVMNLARGSGLDGLSSLQPERIVSDHLRILRPLLSIPRSEIREFALIKNIQWREDLSNEGMHFLRNRVRQEIMPQMRNVFGADVGCRIAATSSLLTNAREIVKRAVWQTAEGKTAVRHKHSEVQGGEVHIVLNTIADESRGMKTEIVRYALHSLSHQPPTMNDTLRTLDLIDCEVGSIATLSGGLHACRERDYIAIGVGQIKSSDEAIGIKSDGVYVAGSVKLEIRRKKTSDAYLDHHPSSATIDLSAVDGDMRWRRWADGDRMVPFGSTHSVLISDLLTNAKISHTDRRACRVLEDNQGILWLCGIRPAERTRVTSATQHVLIIRQTPDVISS
ncbi:MAG: tRNA lysidine(34) synthetase TilS [Ignavibacteria bacterium]|nr:tRNA lysidine(34) synthetase TilS [Ignavibacteria bacterium]